jgi:hypothetical protein
MSSFGCFRMCFWGAFVWQGLKLDVAGVAAGIWKQKTTGLLKEEKEAVGLTQYANPQEAN